MPGKTYCSDSKKAQYKSYLIENRREKNKDRKLEKHFNKHLNDLQAGKRQPGTYPDTKTYNNQFDWSSNWMLQILHKGIR